ncbi:MAG: APC family permease [Janibacter sp.]
MASTGVLARRLTLVDAIAIGLGSMLGAGVFAAFAPAAAAAGWGLLLGLVVAAIVAYGNATSTAQLASQYPTSGGAYIFGREQLGEWPGYLAGWSFVVGKTASCAAMGLTFAAYVAPAGWEKAVAIAAVLAVAGVNCIGVTRTAAATKVIVVIVIAVLALVVAGASSGAGDAPGQFLDLGEHGWYGVLQSAGLIFFAFAGYARVATMGEEVRSPQRTIPRAIVTSLGLTLLIYATIATLALMTLGPERLAASPAPLMDVASAGGWDWTRPIVRIGAAAATLGALLALIAGVGRTSLAMARNSDLPQGLAAVHPRFQVPHRAEVTLAVVVCALILLTDIRSAIGFSSFGVLLYYLIANIAAYTQGQEGRRFPRLLQVVGATGCMVLVVTLPGQSIVGGLAVLMLGIVYRVVRLLARPGPSL